MDIVDNTNVINLKNLRLIKIEDLIENHVKKVCIVYLFVLYYKDCVYYFNDFFYEVFSAVKENLKKKSLRVEFKYNKNIENGLK